MIERSISASRKDDLARPTQELTRLFAFRAIRPTSRVGRVRGEQLQTLWPYGNAEQRSQDGARLSET